MKYSEILWISHVFRYWMQCMVILQDSLPIHSQRQLSAILDLFKSTLPRYYHAIGSLLNKTDKANVTSFNHLQGQWDCDILYHFITICRKRNPKFFSYWALINTASSYGGTNLDLQVFFGLAVTVSTIVVCRATMTKIFVTKIILTQM